MLTGSSEHKELIKIQAEIGLFFSERKGDPKKLMEDLQKILEKMDEEGIAHAAIEEMVSFAELEAAIEA